MTSMRPPSPRCCTGSLAATSSAQRPEGRSQSRRVRCLHSARVGHILAGPPGT